MGWGGVFSGSSARNRPTVGSSGVVTTFRTSIVPSCASATRSVKVPPTSTPTLTTPPPLSPPQCGMWNAECGIERTQVDRQLSCPGSNLARSIPHSAFHTPHSQGPRFQSCSASPPANPKVASTHSVPTQSPRRTYRGITSLVRSRSATIASCSRPVSAYVCPRGSRNSEIPSFAARARSEEHTSELQSLAYLVCRLLLEKKKEEILMF